MIARIQQLTTFTLIFAAAAWAWWFGLREDFALAAYGALMILLGYALFLGLEFLLLAFFGADPSVERPSPTQLLGAWVGEVLRAPLVFCWRQPFRSHSEPDLTTALQPAQRGVVFVHGFFCNRGFWNPWMKTLRVLDVPFIAVTLEPPFGSIAGYAETVESAVARMEATTGHSPVIVAHSMGGLAVRAWLTGCGARHRPHRVITIGSPHRGTWLARFARTVNGLEMRSSSSWIDVLAAGESLADRARFTCFYGNCDNIVFPASVATLSGAENRHLPGTAHVQMAYHPEVMRELLRWLKSTPLSYPGGGKSAVAAEPPREFHRS